MELSEHLKYSLSSTLFALILFLISLFGIFLMFANISPAELEAMGMLAAFGLFYICFLGLFLLIIHILQIVFVNRKTKMAQVKEVRTSSLSMGKLFGIASTLAFAPIILIALRSIGQLDLISASLVILFEVVAIFYILKR